MSVSLRLIKDPAGLLGLFLLMFFLVIGALAPLLAPPAWQTEPYRIPRAGYSAEPQSPSSDHLFGTAEGQYDIYYGVIWGTRTAWKISSVVVVCSALIGVVIGGLAGFYGGFLDELLMRITDIFYAFPFLVGAMVLTTILGRGIWNVAVALVVLQWMPYARLSRAEVLRLRNKEYTIAARAIGANSLRVLLLHILPNGIWPIVVQATMSMGSVVITAATLSFLGLGLPLGYADWGQLISYARNWILGLYGNPLAYWHVIVYPSAAITLFCLSWNLVGDSLRDILDPRMRGIR